ncbi:MAG TPA: hypothetical protein VM432_05825 [Bdellovibrionales bacterium]|nr:hypothetical protein [Bdellovibrionales bacterium]
MKKYFVPLLFLVAAGCASFAKNESSGQIGCPAEEIQIVNDSKTGLVNRTWTAECRDKRFYCSHSYNSNITSCKEEVR